MDTSFIIFLIILIASLFIGGSNLQGINIKSYLILIFIIGAFSYYSYLSTKYNTPNCSYDSYDHMGGYEDYSCDDIDESQKRKDPLIYAFQIFFLISIPITLGAFSIPKKIYIQIKKLFN